LSVTPPIKEAKMPSLNDDRRLSRTLIFRLMKGETEIVRHFDRDYQEK